MQLTFELPMRFPRPKPSAPNAHPNRPASEAAKKEQASHGDRQTKEIQKKGQKIIPDNHPFLRRARLGRNRVTNQFPTLVPDFL